MLHLVQMLRHVSSENRNKLRDTSFTNPERTPAVNFRIIIHFCWSHPNIEKRFLLKSCGQIASRANCIAWMVADPRSTQDACCRKMAVSSIICFCCCFSLLYENTPWQQLFPFVVLTDTSRALCRRGVRQVVWTLSGAWLSAVLVGGEGVGMGGEGAIILSQAGRLNPTKKWWRTWSSSASSSSALPAPAFCDWRCSSRTRALFTDGPAM